MPCWNLFCVSPQCDGVEHIDATGYWWFQIQQTPDTDFLVRTAPDPAILVTHDYDLFND